MAKSPKSKPLTVSDIEDAIRDAVSNIPGIYKVPELEYCKMVIEAIDTYKVGIEMRKGELEQKEE